MQILCLAGSLLARRCLVEKVVWLDFNDAPEQATLNKPRIDARELKHRLLDCLPSVLNYLFPAGKQRGKQFIVGIWMAIRAKVW